MQASPHVAEDWFDDDFARSWIDRDGARGGRRQRHFVMVRALLPFDRQASFHYLNLGAGPGGLDEVLLASFPNARATLLDGSAAMLSAAKQQLAPMGDRVSFVQADLRNPSWRDTIQGSYDAAVSTIALHNLFDPVRIRTLYAELLGLLTDGGLFINLDNVRLADARLTAQARWAARDQEAGFAGGGGRLHMPGTIDEQLGWLREAGFIAVDCFWRELGAALFCGWRGRVQVPEA